MIYSLIILGLVALVWYLLSRKRADQKWIPSENREAAKAESTEETNTDQSETAQPTLSQGIAGDVKLYDTPPRTAATLMAIVAYEMHAPLNELRFRSIREIREEK